MGGLLKIKSWKQLGVTTVLPFTYGALWIVLHPAEYFSGTGPLTGSGMSGPAGLVYFALALLSTSLRFVWRWVAGANLPERLPGGISGYGGRGGSP